MLVHDWARHADSKCLQPKWRMLICRDGVMVCYYDAGVY